MNRFREGDERFRAEWRKLGFFCDFAEASGRWRFVGSRGGLLKFCDLLDEYVDDPRNAEPLGEHDHCGPYMHLKIETWHEPEIVGEGPPGFPARSMTSGGWRGSSRRSWTRVAQGISLL